MIARERAFETPFSCLPPQVRIFPVRQGILPGGLFGRRCDARSVIDVCDVLKCDALDSCDMHGWHLSVVAAVLEPAKL